MSWRRMAHYSKSKKKGGKSGKSVCSFACDNTPIDSSHFLDEVIVSSLLGRLPALVGAIADEVVFGLIGMQQRFSTC